MNHGAKAQSNLRRLVSISPPPKEREQHRHVLASNNAQKKSYKRCEKKESQNARRPPTRTTSTHTHTTQTPSKEP